jgi:hypothetical protein
MESILYDMLSFCASNYKECRKYEFLEISENNKHLLG